MQTFENKLSFFKEKEVNGDSLHKFVLQKMNKQVNSAERRKVLAKRSVQRKAPAIGDCLSVSLYDEAVS